MARYKYIDTSPRFLPVDLARQLMPGTFEHALNHLLDHAIDLSAFDARFRNDATGPTAYPPALLLKVVLFAYARGIVSSRAIERACREHVTFIALCGDRAPHFTTIAQFVSTLGEDIARVFAAVVAICDRQGLIGREMFAIDGVKLPSNASKRRSRAGDGPVRPQLLEHRRRQQGVAILLAFPLLDPQTLAGAVHIREAEGQRLHQAQPRAVHGHQHRAVLQVRDRGQEPAQFGAAEDDRERLGLPGERDVLDQARPLERGAVEEPQRAHRLIERAPGHPLGLDQMSLVRPDVLGPQGGGRLPDVPGEPGHAVDVTVDGARGVVPGAEIRDHPLV